MAIAIKILHELLLLLAAIIGIVLAAATLPAT
jgi:hypothetical protein